MVSISMSLAVGYKASIISTVVDKKERIIKFQGYKASIISTVVDSWL